MLKILKIEKMIKILTENSAPWIKPIQTGFESVNSDSLSQTIGKSHRDQ